MDKTIFIIMIDERPYGYFVEEGDLQPQLDNAKKEAIPKFEFNKIFYWDEIKSDDEDVISKWKCTSIDKNDFMRYERLECVLEVVKSSLIEPSKENDEDAETED
jgi:hypothetical protein